ncbi:MAG TPA: precorrin-6y C5,15-methyltransferase (decarboxylating) subunit CbiE, partial [Acidimicrobiales bacterium]|nr:precorrin-6y C5,15-methyltransferase (decarboxylating) subunit CbiE [Acidimicrobiales bacterium]
MPRRIRVVGISGGTAGLGGPALEAVRSAGLVLGAPRHLEAVASLGDRVEGQRVAPLPSPLEALLEEVAGEPGPVCVLASGDPGFFGVVRPLAERFGPDALEVHPGPASVSLAFARLGLPWDDAQVVSAHGRPPGEAAAAAARADKAAVLTSPECPPEALARRLVELGAGGRRAAVCSRLGL